MRNTLVGLAVIIVGTSLGVWLGVWVLLIGGIVQCIEGIKADPVDSFDVALGLARFFAAGLVGWGITIVSWTFGIAMMDD